MTEKEYELIDELYFVTAFDDLQNELNWTAEDLVNVLRSCIESDWIRCYSAPDIELELSEVNIDDNFKDYLYLASKKGLLKHNTV
ncbi:hypothetical protein KMW28_07025 [Flammeovirga yaeyamensis]|uniref:Uncharacterized protein n=1 Tax=Flammeovirga yaeyamensis TaxID=367791 RepID=A0AAX1N755_9BACT|nr:MULTISPECIES: hypothetical protein [Flammeovirga]ANQ49209.1 hypothetical protein MY04_1835 [Flammeovirga sp. MY04]MBB3697928.1 hypothetical protein [Flammeovirga yaeyamensis]NMF35717.1 hypothetical protein [Flammeovirga yaeyamensis]QWG03330.1 hypothetical protein KMW28_07025 [Flammeovirga yaeyamensis]